MILLKQMIILFLVMMLGYMMAQKKVIDKKVSKSLSWIIVNIANPALIISGSQGNHIEKKEMLFLIILAFGLFLFLILLAEIIIPVFKPDSSEKGAYKMLFVFSNIGFMGLPIISSVYGSKGLLYGSVFLLPFNILIYTYGIMCMSKQKTSIRQMIIKLFNIGLIASIISLVLAVNNVTIPNFAGQIVTMLSALTAPLSMMVIGASFTEISIKHMFRDVRLLLFALLKLVIIPIIGITVVKFITSDNILRVCFIMLATPSGSMVAMMAEQYNGNHITAAKGVAFTTVLSVITMPLLFAIMGI